MALTFGFYDSVNGDRTYNAKDFSRFFDGILTDGIFGDIGDELRVTAGSGLSVNVGIGRAWFNRTWTWNDNVLNITIPTADPVLPRIDTVALIIDDTLRTNSIEIIQGTASSSPVAPTLTNTSDHHEYRLANVAVAATATSITNNDITDFVGTTQTPYTNVMPTILFFQNATMPVMDGQASIGVKKEYARSDHRHPTDTSRAPIQSPTFTGIPKAQTAAAGTNTTQIATTEFVKTAIDNVIGSKANLASPTFTGTPKAPTAAAGTDTTQIATTAFVHANVRNKIYTATCSTASGTVAKVATIDGSSVGFSLTKGVRVYVTFTNGHDPYGSQSGRLIPTLNVNGTGAKTIVLPNIFEQTDEHDLTSYDAEGYHTLWHANDTVLFTYTGTYWAMSPSSQMALTAWAIAENYMEYGVSLNDTKTSPNYVIAGPESGTSAGLIRRRALVPADIPSLDASKIATGTLSVSRGGTGATTFPSDGILIGNGTGAISTRELDYMSDSVDPMDVNSSGAIYTASTRKHIMTREYLGFALKRSTSVNSSDVNYNKLMARGIALYDSSLSPSLTINGAIIFMYE